MCGSAAPFTSVVVGLLQDFEVVVEGAHPRLHLLFFRARQEADVFTHGHRGARDDDLVVELLVQHLLKARRQRQQRLARAC